MQETVFGLPVFRDVNPSSTEHQPGSIELCLPQPLRGFAFDLTKTSFVSVKGFDIRGKQTSAVQVPQLPTALGNAASSAIEWVATRFVGLRA